MDVKLKEAEVVQAKDSMQKNCATCSKLEEKNKKSDAKCVELQMENVNLKLEIVKMNSEYEALEAKFMSLENGKLAIETELMGLKAMLESHGSEKGGKRLVGSTGDGDDKVKELRVKNFVLLWEKKRAESEVEVCKERCTELELRVLQLEKGLIMGSGEGKMKMNSEELGFTCDSNVKGASNPQNGTSHNDTTSKCTGSVKSENRGRLIKKCLAFDKDEIPCENIAPSVPASGKPVINIHDGDEENDSGPIVMPCVSTMSALDDDNCNLPFSPTRKRRRPSYIVTSDTENDDDDNYNVPKMMHDIAALRRRRLAAIRGMERLNFWIPPTENSEDDKDSESEGSLKDFIVTPDSDDDVSSASGDTVDCADSGGESDNESEGKEGFGEILSRIKRTKDDKMKWEFEADMLAAFGKDPELCMKAVCALYRQQTLEEQISRESLCGNGRGFNKFDANRGSTLAVFLTDGEPHGEVKKSVIELQRYDSKGVDDCRRLATHYSKQLFEIYTNKEDPFFLPSIGKL